MFVPPPATPLSATPHPQNPALPPRPALVQVGMVHSSRPGEDDRKSLRQLSFQAGDYLDVAIYS